MKIVIDALGAPSDSGGMQRYAEELVRTWHEQHVPGDSLVLVADTWARQQLGSLPGIEIHEIKSGNILRRSLGQLLIVPWTFYRSGASHVLSVSPIVSPLVPRTARACIVHDWRHLKNPREFSRMQRIYRRLWRGSVANAGTVFAISSKTYSETVALIPVASVLTVESGRDHPRRWLSPPAKKDQMRTIVTFGHHTNKRPELAIQGFATLAPEVRNSCRLVIVGTQRQYGERLLNLARALGVLEQVSLPGFVPQRDYECYIASASLVLLVSSDEGFGLPIAEAEFLGIPSIATNDSGLGELHGAQLRVVDPCPDAIGAAILDALCDDRSQQHPTRIRTWAETVSEIRNALGSVADDPARARM